MSLTLPAWIRVLMPGGQVEEMKLETYLAGAVAAEIGTAAPLEALKTQAIASRTYAVSMRHHPAQNADVCTTAHCQKWIRVDPVFAPEVFRALSETWSMVAVYDGKLISAFFFEHCDGHTRNAEEMLIPPSDYLRGVDCSCGFLTLKGHGVGMCKRGAIMMARRGASFEQILSHYYRGVGVAHAMVVKQAAPGRESVQPAHAPKSKKPPRAQRKVEPPPAAPQPAKTRRKPAAPPKSPRRSPRSVAEPAPPVFLPPKVRRSEERAPIQPTTRIESVQVVAEETTRIAEQFTPAESSAQTDMVPTIAEEPAPTPEPVAEIPALAPTTIESTTELPAETSAALPQIAHESGFPELGQISRVTVPRVLVDYLPGGRMIAGCLSRAGVVISIEDAKGNKTLAFSGSAPHYGEGGFEAIVDEDGAYRVLIDGQTIPVTVRGETAFIHVA